VTRFGVKWFIRGYRGGGQAPRRRDRRLVVKTRPVEEAAVDSFGSQAGGSLVYLAPAGLSEFPIGVVDTELWISTDSMDLIASR
jgi:hypothetical protein